MTAAVGLKLLAIGLTVAVGWLAARLRWLDAGAGVASTGAAARVLSNLTFMVFVPALLFRTTARIDLAALPWRTVAAYFVPALTLAVVVYAIARLRRRPDTPVAAPAVRAITAAFGNSVQFGIPLAAALFGETGLALHLALVSLHALLLLSLVTMLVESDLARAQAGSTRWAAVRGTVRNSVIHPVVLPVLAGLGWNAAGLALPALADEVLGLLGAAVVPLCLVLIGVSLAAYGVRGAWRGALLLSALKLVALPAAVLAVGWLAFGLRGQPLAVLVMMAALPVGSNALLFAQRYDTMAAAVTTAIVASTVAFAATGALWLAVLARLPGT